MGLTPAHLQVHTPGGSAQEAADCREQGPELGTAPVPALVPRDPPGPEERERILSGTPTSAPPPPPTTPRALVNIQITPLPAAVIGCGSSNETTPPVTGRGR